MQNHYLWLALLLCYSAEAKVLFESNLDPLTPHEISWSFPVAVKATAADESAQVTIHCERSEVPEYKAYFKNPRLLKVEFLQPLEPGAKCSAFTNYRPYEKQNFTLPLVKISAIFPWSFSQLKEDSTFIVVTEAPVSHGRLADLAYIEVEGLSEKIELDAITGEARSAALAGTYLPLDQTVIVLKPRRIFPADKKVSLVVPAGITFPAIKTGKVSRPFMVNLICERAVVDGPCSALGPVGLRFSAPVRSRDLAGTKLQSQNKEYYLQLSPIETELHEVFFSSALDSETEYQLHLPAALMDLAGREPDNLTSFPLKFKLAAYPARLTQPPARDFSAGFAELKASHPSSFKEILDAKGELLAEIRIDSKNHRRSWALLNDLPDNFIRELLTFQDPNFFSHWGVNPLSWNNTITMQTAALIGPSTSKLEQIKNALWLETKWSKQEILEAYLNLLRFKGNLEGINAASLGFFGKYPANLNQPERLILLSLITEHNESKSKILTRACHYQQKLYPDKSCLDLEQTAESSFINHPRTHTQANFIPHLVSKLQLEPGERVFTSINKDLQLLAMRMLNSSLPRKANGREGAILVIDRDSGKILTYVGSSDSFARPIRPDQIQAIKATDSVLAPFIFAQAIGRRLITMTSPDMTAERAMDLLTPGTFNQLRSDLQLPREISLWSLVRAYRTLAQGGEFRELSYLADVTHQKQQISELNPAAVFIANHMGRGRNFKTSSDNWSIGYTSKYVIGVWLEHSSAKHIYDQIVSHLHQSDLESPADMPEGVTKHRADFYLTGTEPKQESFKLIPRLDMARLPQVSQPLHFRQSSLRGHRR